MGTCSQIYRTENRQPGNSFLKGCVRARVDLDYILVGQQHPTTEVVFHEILKVVVDEGPTVGAGPALALLM